ncbi:MAG: hypothetical protein HRT69_13855 [Flavobacteriaceae bacterium]|nr:hypothetical protein [Flavobacteriaceae bacterium]
MSNLITITDIKVYKPIADSLDVTMKLDTFISEAQEFDLKPLLDDPLYLALLADAPLFADVDLSNLFNGSIYTYNDKQYQHEGLKSVLVYYSYSRYKNDSNSNDTAFGTVLKLNPDSEKVDEKVIQRQVHQAISGASAKWNDVLKFIQRNKEKYPLFDCGSENTKTGGIKITAVRR